MMSVVVPIDSSIGHSKTMDIVPLDDDKFDDGKQEEKPQIIQEKQIIQTTQTRNKKSRNTNIIRLMEDVMNNVFWMLTYLMVIVLMCFAGPILVTILYCTRDKRVKAEASNKRWFWNFIGSVFTTALFWLIVSTIYKNYS